MSFENAAGALAERVRATKRGFLTLRREELREAFGIGRFTEQQSDSIVAAIVQLGLLVYPHPFVPSPTVRLYDRKHSVGQIAESVLVPGEMPDTPLRNAAQAFAREHAGRDLRSDDVVWISAFDLLLQVVLGRPPEGWEDLNDDRHPSQLARELGHALGLAAGVTDLTSTLRIAAAVCALRPRRRRWTVGELASPTAPAAATVAFLGHVRAAHLALQTEHEHLLREAALLLLGGETVPEVPVELGLLGLRFRREEADGEAGGGSAT
jgi:hypothetical protein